jgi:hypothetical protein
VHAEDGITRLNVGGHPRLFLGLAMLFVLTSADYLTRAWAMY